MRNSLAQKSKKIASTGASEPGAVATGQNLNLKFLLLNDTDDDPLSVWPVATAPGSDVEALLVQGHAKPKAPLE